MPSGPLGHGAFHKTPQKAKGVDDECTLHVIGKAKDGDWGLGAGEW